MRTRALLKSLGISAGELSRAICLSKEQVSRRMNGLSRWRISELRAVWEFLCPHHGVQLEAVAQAMFLDDEEWRKTST